MLSCEKNIIMSRVRFPFAFQEMFGEQQQEMDNDLVVLVILAGLAKPGDTPEQIKVNIATAQEYAKAVTIQREQLKAEEYKAVRIKDLESKIQEAMESVLRKTEKIQAKKVMVAELERIAKVTIGESMAKPVTRRGQEILSDYNEAVISLQDLQARLKETEEYLARYQKDLRGIKGEPEPAPTV